MLYFYRMSDPTTKVSECDYLDVDPPIRGQNFACISFISPEDVIAKKEVFFFQQYLKSFSKEIIDFFEMVKIRYPNDADKVKSIAERYPAIFNPERTYDDYLFFTTENNDILEKEYHEKNEFRTSIRGIKIRGIYDTMKEAEIRSQVLKKIDSNFNVYVGQVGSWLPWNPNPDTIDDQEYSETHLNTLVKKYKENQTKKDIFYEERKRDLQQAATEENKKQIEKNNEQKEADAAKALADAKEADAAKEADEAKESSETIDEITEPGIETEKELNDNDFSFTQKESEKISATELLNSL